MAEQASASVEGGCLGSVGLARRPLDFVSFGEGVGLVRRKSVTLRIMVTERRNENKRDGTIKWSGNNRDGTAQLSQAPMLEQQLGDRRQSGGKIARLERIRGRLYFALALRNVEWPQKETVLVSFGSDRYMQTTPVFVPEP